jgi:hypothetical protein
MKFKDYITAIKKTDNIFCITEICENRFCHNYTTFNFETEDPENEDNESGKINGREPKMYFVLYQDEMHAHLDHTFIDVEQEIELKDGGVVVMDKDDNKIILLFFTLAQINHPTL